MKERMLLKVGAALMLLSLMLAAGVAAAIGLRSGPPKTETAASVGPRAAEKKTEEKRKFDPGKKLEIGDEPGKVDDGTGKADDEPGKEPAPKSRFEEPQPESAPRAGPTPSPTAIPDWPRPTNDEVAAAEEPRYFAPQPGAQLSLTVEALGLYDVPVTTSDNLEALDGGLMHLPETSFPWDPGAQRNVFIAGHYLGWPGTASRLVFHNLDRLKNGDEVVLKDSGGRAYRYRVSESFTAMPDDSWVMGQELNRDMVTLQTCISPNFEERLIVRADRV